ncbi:MAG: VWA domain-containing protein [Deltaproteobacteria bacterium]|nr:VWA domain-containing protein [Deltaproteobacteria bacterium]
MTRSAHLLWLTLPLAVAAYGCDSDSDTTSTTTTSSGTGGTAGAGGSAAGGSGGDGGWQSSSSSGTGGATCVPPDLLIVLDRTMSMHRQPDGTPAEGTPTGKQQSKWYIAIDAIETSTALFEGGMRFGLELFPLDPGPSNGTEQCVTLDQRINGITATNTPCQEGEVVVPTALNSASAIDGAIDPETTLLCTSTPIGAGLTTAKDELAATKLADQEDRDQFALLITDGQDTCDESLPLSEMQAMAAAGVKTFVVGFDATQGTGVDAAQLNDLACAGLTAEGFPGSCMDDGMGNYTWDPNGPATVYIVAENGDDLSTALSAIAAEVCCDCID